ncbi:hypothetical protein M5K25_022184 [Dendrobium thyrsiflorum]|uniref:Reverse transcriptase zinc-binding domain-containing protein n=1 Tax=Dendrobium thyrsiflorum TaxID=117978 RepID=A0ABD0U5X1_DENTH
MELQRYFHNELIMLILQIPINSTMDDDQVKVMFQHSGRSISAMSYEEVMRGRVNEDDCGYSNWLMKLKLNPRVELFWWRLSKHAIPTNHYLKYRRLCYDDSCARWCQEEENYAHIMVHCKYLIDIILKLRDWGFSIPIFHSLGSCLEELKRLSFGYSNIVKMESHNAWHPPPLDWIKINVNASIFSSNLARIGGVFRDHKGYRVTGVRDRQYRADIMNFKSSSPWESHLALALWITQEARLEISIERRVQRISRNLIKAISLYLMEIVQVSLYSVGVGPSKSLDRAPQLPKFIAKINDRVATGNTRESLQHNIPITIQTSPVVFEKKAVARDRHLPRLDNNGAVTRARRGLDRVEGRRECIKPLPIHQSPVQLDVYRVIETISQGVSSKRNTHFASNPRDAFGVPARQREIVDFYPNQQRRKVFTCRLEFWMPFLEDEGASKDEPDASRPDCFEVFSTGKSEEEEPVAKREELERTLKRPGLLNSGKKRLIKRSSADRVSYQAEPPIDSTFGEIVTIKGNDGWFRRHRPHLPVSRIPQIAHARAQIQRPHLQTIHTIHSRNRRDIGCRRHTLNLAHNQQIFLTASEVTVIDSVSRGPNDRMSRAADAAWGKAAEGDGELGGWGIFDHREHDPLKTEYCGSAGAGEGSETWEGIGYASRAVLHIDHYRVSSRRYFRSNSKNGELEGTSTKEAKKAFSDAFKTLPQVEQQRRNGEKKQNVQMTDQGAFGTAAAVGKVDYEVGVQKVIF